MKKLFIGILAVMFVLSFAVTAKAVYTNYLEIPSGDYMDVVTINAQGAVVSATPTAGKAWGQYEMDWVEGQAYCIFNVIVGNALLRNLSNGPRLPYSKHIWNFFPADDNR